MAVLSALGRRSKPTVAMLSRVTSNQAWVALAMVIRAGSPELGRRCYCRANPSEGSSCICLFQRNVLGVHRVAGTQVDRGRAAGSGGVAAQVVAGSGLGTARVASTAGRMTAGPGQDATAVKREAN